VAGFRCGAVRGGVAAQVAARGEALVGGGGQGARPEVLNPPAGPQGPSGNEDSVVLLFRLRGQAAVLFLGDVGSVTERELAVPRVHVLKVGHHGSRHSTSDELLTAARPSLAVVSVGRHTYGQSLPDALDRV